jgi:nucleotide-binding universal stress UspA family protein
MRVLFGVDESEFSKEAVRFARSIGWPAGSHALVLSIVRTDVYAFGEFYAPAAVELESLWEEEDQRASDLAEATVRELQAAGLPAEKLVLRGDPRFVLVDAARDRGADLLVIGSHGRSGLSKLVLGSVASHVVTHAPCSVLVVKRPAG